MLQKMERSEIQNSWVCPSPELSAYLDGELASSAEIELELHMSLCRICTDDLNLQKSFLIALDYSLDAEIEIDLPKNFTKLVVANAESSVSGLRRPHERTNAALICLTLIAFSLFALGSSAGKTFVATAAIFEKIFIVFSSAGHVVYDFALGSAIIFRSLASKVLFDAGGTVLVFLALFVLSLCLFPRLVVRHHRT
ncbi:MAG: zf-HC2 domain-containing protein [Pyrinomonadaceae bacterium]